VAGFGATGVEILVFYQKVKWMMMMMMMMMMIVRIRLSGLFRFRISLLKLRLLFLDIFAGLLGRGIGPSQGL
jgi:hypothetical protein